MPIKYIIISGDPITGFKTIGPFPDRETASNYCGTVWGGDGSDYWTMELAPPETQNA